MGPWRRAVMAGGSFPSFPQCGLPVKSCSSRIMDGGENVSQADLLIRQDWTYQVTVTAHAKILSRPPAASMNKSCYPYLVLFQECIHTLGRARLSGCRATISFGCIACGSSFHISYLSHRHSTPMQCVRVLWLRVPFFVHRTISTRSSLCCPPLTNQPNKLFLLVQDQDSLQ